MKEVKRSYIWRDRRIIDVYEHPVDALPFGRDRKHIEVNVDGLTNTKAKLVLLRSLGLIVSDLEWVVARNAIKHCKACLMIKHWYEVLPKEVVAWAWKAIEQKAEEESSCCVDGERCAKVGNTSQWRRFVRDRTCCGSDEWIDVGPDGNRYHLGYNYGH